MAGVGIVAQFAQRLAANEKSHRDKAVRKLQKWITARSACNVNDATKEEVFNLWKGLFYCMWMSDKPLIQEELAGVLSDLVLRLSNFEYTLLFIDAFFATMDREWTGIDYLRIDKFMMLVRKFLSACFQLLSRLKWEPEQVDRLLDVLSNCAIATSETNSGDGLQLHVADIYVEELSKVAADEISDNDLSRFFKPYCNLLVSSTNSILRKSIIERIFKFTIRLCDDEDEDDDDDENDVDTNGETENAEEVQEHDGVTNEDESDDDSIESEDDARLKYASQREWRHRLRRHETDAQKLPYPKFDYQDIGDTLLEIVGKTEILSLRHRSEVYELVKHFHEMAKGIFPLDVVETAKGSRLRRSDIDSAAKRLLEDDEEDALEARHWKTRFQRQRKKRRSGDVDEDDTSSAESSLSEDETEDFDDFSSSKHKSSRFVNSASEESFEVNDDIPQTEIVVDKLLQRLLAKKESVTQNKTPKKRNKKQKLIDGNSDFHNGINGDDTRLDEDESSKVHKSPVMNNLESKQTDSASSPTTPTTSNSKKRKRKSKSPLSSGNGNDSKISEVVSCDDATTKENSEINTKTVTKASPNKLGKSKKRKMNSQPSNGQDLENSDKIICDQVTTTENSEASTPSPKTAAKSKKRKRVKSLTVVKNDHDLIQHDEIGSDEVTIKINSDCGISKQCPEVEIIKASSEAKREESEIDKLALLAFANVCTIEKFGSESKIGQKSESHSPDMSSESLRENECNDKALGTNVNHKTNGENRSKNVNGKMSKKENKVKDFLAGFRYFDMPMNSEENTQVNKKEPGKKETPKPIKRITPEPSSNSSENFAEFDNFLKKPPVFFRTAVDKFSPKTKRPVFNQSSVLKVNGINNTTTPKKVIFELNKNVAHEDKEYENFVRNSPAVPFNAQNLPTQGVLKVKSQKPFIGLNVKPKKRAVAKDFFVFDE